MYGSGSGRSPSPMTLGLGVGFLLILLVSIRACTPDGQTVLQTRFAAQGATESARATAGEPIVPLPAPIQSLSETTVARLQGGEAVVPMTPVVTNDALKVDIQQLQSVAGGLQVKGTVRNNGKKALKVPLSAFRFTDQTGTVYAAQGDAAATLPPGGQTSLDLTLPIQNPTSLTMVVELPADNIRLEMQLLTSQP